MLRDWSFHRSRYTPLEARKQAAGLRQDGRGVVLTVARCFDDLTSDSFGSETIVRYVRSHTPERSTQRYSGSRKYSNICRSFYEHVTYVITKRFEISLAL